MSQVADRAPAVRAPARRRPSRRPAAAAAKGAAVAGVLFFTLFPAYFMLTSAVSGKVGSGFEALIPTAPTLANFTEVLTRGNFLTYLGNSLLVALITVLGSSLLALFAAVAVARFRFRFRTTVLIMILVIQMVPLEALVIPLFLQARELQLLNSLLGLSLVYIALSLPFAVWMLRGFVAAVPAEVEEAAYLDGASWGRMFWSVLLPLVAPGLVATSIFSFITAWNEFILALTFFNDTDKYTVAVGLRAFFGQNTTDWGLVMAGSTIITLPVMVFFLFVQRGLASGLVAGAVKG
ncbi:carbohydrate ABC transporter membrane protein 2 (CUT1 family) [Murinocardiopsis flavida]|uniref:Carbohydrate ABC transporter membrane protein 2 (CUT1 family) n=1 Tax=Murinocardiopsis flavida TaxID=645275 RepID=A0A2P8DU24_9ACTN|nr:carbohydrate ABC transporter permease [Murinocardiopsis flavida]PSL00726.1 carbohydrate ABC transporter membrane protein 2 (CUT1 family) [Murinocardiopsis flavida]